MNREDIIKLARECGLPSDELYHPNLERFAALVAAAEREACAKVCEDWIAWNMDDPGSTAANAIRARGKHD